MRKMKNKTTMLLAGGLAVVLILFAAAAIYFGMIVKDRSGSQLPEETEKPVMVEQGGQEKPQETQGLDVHTIRLSWVIFRNIPDTSRFICRPVMWKIVVGRLH